MHIKGFEVDRNGYIKRELHIPVPIPYYGNGYGFLSLEDGIYEILKGAEDAFIVRKSLDRRKSYENRPVG